MYVKLTRIDYADVVKHIHRAVPEEPSRSPRFNSYFHKHMEAPDSTIPSEYPYSFKRWLPLILRSRGLLPSDSQVVTLSSAQARLLLKAADASIPAGYVSRLYREEINQEIIPAFANLRFPHEGLFLRLDACSAKDRVLKVPRRASLHSVEDIILRLVTSQRARSVLFKAVQPSIKRSSFDVEKTGKEPFDLFFLPFNHRMESTREYRVFCPPIWNTVLSTAAPISDIHISAISQSLWHKPWLFAKETEAEAEKIAQKIANGCRKILNEILEEADLCNKVDNGLFWQGLSFDVWFDEEMDTIQLVELNVFGCRSGCGSCLFHWKDDKLVLYNPSTEKLEFRVTF
ncbi:hypothetical protein F5Y06DRAFT_304953 [Hypoxylon sp. FL0890]|nr:hypothetical protein F5Y06DRAFT_304953 [Hypoxylon sp. FL0890]